LSSALRALAQSTGTTLYMVLVAAFDVLLCHHTHRRDVVIGTDVSGRHTPGTEDLVGCTVNQLVLRTRIPDDEDPSFREILQRVRSTVLAAIDHQELPFELLLRDLKPPREPGRPPLFQVKMVYQQAPVERFEQPDISFESLAVDSGASKWDLLL